ncbi:flagellar filament capping protein FliD [Idiomarina xiamenensis]|uniref:Flagellar hook-associated protein 2 n=1 Tax=Idiomarina xiamenensis 10-D-4 TaxID=740709 RepID=K2JZG4_9GAMM|nr:flagellar filament capping protein FliD [Idiomarina xiamenensis]EKE80848.1 Flagellar capping protein [Idiomarina xiamenensis 10-D-4]
MPSFAGIGSNLPLEDLITSTVAAANQPKVKRFNEAQSRYEVELSALGAVKSQLSKFQSVVDKLADADEFYRRTSNITQPASGDAIAFTSTADSSVGQFSVEVQQLAQGSRAISAAGAFATSDQVVSDSDATLTFSAGDKSFSVDISAGETLEQVRRRVNDMTGDNFGVSMNIINTGSEAKVVFSSSLTGAGNDLEVTSNNADFDGMSTTAADGSAGGLTIADADKARDAIISIDGITATNSSNTFADVIEGSTIIAKKVTAEGESATVDISHDREGVDKLIDEFVAAYNGVVDIINQATAFNKNTGASAALNGDASMRGLQQQMVIALSSEVTDSGKFNNLFDLGLSLDKDGKLQRENVVRSVNEAMDDDFASFAKVFSSDEGIGSKFEEMLGNYLGSGGVISQREDSLDERLRGIADDREAHKYRMEQLEAQLREKYTALDVLVSQMQSTSDYLTQQLASLPGFGSKK